LGDLIAEAGATYKATSMWPEVQIPIMKQPLPHYVEVKGSLCSMAIRRFAGFGPVAIEIAVIALTHIIMSAKPITNPPSYRVL
jgi:hypothetical protein